MAKTWSTALVPVLRRGGAQSGQRETDSTIETGHSPDKEKDEFHHRGTESAEKRKCACRKNQKHTTDYTDRMD